MKRHSSTRQRYEPYNEKTCSTLRWLRRYDELRQNIAVMCIITKNVSLLPWVVCVSGISSYFDDGSSTLYRSISVIMERVDGTLWSWVMNSRDVIPSITSDWWTIYVCEFSVTRWTPSSRHFYCLRSEMLLLQLLLMEHFSSSVHHLPHVQPGQRTLIISSFVLPKTSTSRLQLKLCIVIDNISSQLRETL